MKQILRLILILAVTSACSDNAAQSSSCGVPLDSITEDSPEEVLPLVIVLNGEMPEDTSWDQRATYGCSANSTSEECAEYSEALEQAICPESYLCLTHSLENQHYCMPKCPDGLSACDGHCVDGRSNNNYCGANEDCSEFTVCSYYQSCYGGECIKVTSESCEEGDKSCLSDTTLHACLDGGWVTVDCSSMGMTCAGGQCVNTKAECDEATYVKTCLADDRTRLFCEGAHILNEECGTAQRCLNGECIDVVVEGDTSEVGCSDGEREGFLDLLKYPNIAACSGGWSIGGIFETANAPACDRNSGDDSENPNGTGCNIQDLCAPGWHVCTGRQDVTARTGTLGCTEITKGTEDERGYEPPAFFLSRELTGGSLMCHGDYLGTMTATEDGSGCGNLGCPVDNDMRGCAPLNRGLHNMCSGINTQACPCSGSGEDIHCSTSPCSWCRTLGWYAYRDNKAYASGWNCGGNSTQEARNITKSSPDLGGVLCCRDDMSETE